MNDEDHNLLEKLIAYALERTYSQWN
jgi:hypothetical protein